MLGILVGGFAALPAATHPEKRKSGKKLGWLGGIGVLGFTAYLTLTDSDSTAAIGLVTIVPLLAAAAGIAFFWAGYALAAKRH